MAFVANSNDRFTPEKIVQVGGWGGEGGAGLPVCLLPPTERAAKINIAHRKRQVVAGFVIFRVSEKKMYISLAEGQAHATSHCV